MKWRLREGRGEAIYEIGVADNGLLLGLSEEDLGSSLNTLNRMADRYVYWDITVCPYKLIRIFHVCVSNYICKHYLFLASYLYHYV